MSQNTKSHQNEKALSEIITPTSDLEFINRNFGYGISEPVSNEEIDSKDNRLSRIVRSLVWPSFDRYISSGISFRGAIVRLLNNLYEAKSVARQIERDDLELLVSKRIEEGTTKLTSELNSLQQKVIALENAQAQSVEFLKQLDSVTRGLESIISMNKQNVSKEPLQNTLEGAQLDYSYLLLENRYRGSEEEILSRMGPYADYIEAECRALAIDAEVIEIGCGRGELLSLLKEKGVKAKGLELDLAMCQRCASKDLLAEPINPLDYFSNVPNSSIAGVVAIQVIEHLTGEYRKSLLEILHQKLMPGAFLIFETINTSSFLPLLQNYFRDPTHTTPMHPDTLRTLLEQSGFDIIDVRYSSEYPEQVKIQPLPKPEGMPFRHQEMVRQLNERFEHLNKLIYGSQDYAIFAKRRSDNSQSASKYA